MATVRKLLPYIIGLYVLAVLANLFADRDQVLWDYKIYHYAVDADNPYSGKEVAEESELATGVLSYKYPPLTLNLFKPFNSIGVESGLILYFVLLVMALAIVLGIWVKLFKPNKDPWFFLLILLGFNGAWFLGMRSGNIILILTTLLWIAFYFFLEKKYTWFVVLVLIASFFKLTPVFFLGLLLFVPGKSARIAFFSGVTLFGCYLLLNQILYPDLFDKFVQGIKSTTREHGIVAPGLLTLFENGFAIICNEVGIDTGNTPLVLYAIVATIVVWQSVKIISTTKPDTGRFELNLIVLGTIVYLLILPRVKDYDYILVLPALWYVLSRLKASIAGIILILPMLSVMNVKLPLVEQTFSLLWDYYPVIVLISIWVLFRIRYLEFYEYED